MDLATLMQRLLDLERAIGRVDPIDLRRRIVAIQLGVLEMQRQEIERVPEVQLLMSRPAVLYQVYEAQAVQCQFMLCAGEPPVETPRAA